MLRPEIKIATKNVFFFQLFVYHLYVKSKHALDDMHELIRNRFDSITSNWAIERKKQ